MSTSTVGMMLTVYVLAALTLGTTPATPSAPQKRTAALSVGDLAPAFQPDGWILGTPVTNFKKGQVYVIEFWATWCQPCIASMPELSNVADATKGKATVISVNVWDRPGDERKQKEAHRKRITDFVKKNVRNMRFNIALDDAQDTLARTWLKASNRSGIPAAFIVNQQGRIAWIGHPMGLGSALNKVIKGGFDLEKSRKQFDSENIRAETEANQLQRLSAAAKAGDQAKFDRLFIQLPGEPTSRVMSALNATGRQTPDFLMVYFDKNWAKFTSVPPDAWVMFMGMIFQQAKSPKTIDLAMKRSEECLARTPKDMKAYALAAYANHLAWIKRPDESRRQIQLAEAAMADCLPSIKGQVTEGIQATKKKLDG